MIVYRNAAGKILTHNGKILIPGDFSGYTVRLPVLPTGVTQINYIYTDFTTNQESNIDASTVTQQTITVPKNCSVSAAVTCPSWSTVYGSYGPWTITGDTTLPSPSIEFNASPTQTNFTASYTQINLYYRNSTSIPVNIVVQAYKNDGTLAGAGSAINLAADDATVIHLTGLSEGTTYICKAYYVDPAGNIVANTSKQTSSTITTDTSSSQS